MKLKKGITLHNLLSESDGVISINSGTVHNKNQITEPVDFNGIKFTPQYEDKAYVTKRDWRKLSISEVGLLKSNNSRNDNNTVYLGSIPDDLKKCFQQLSLGSSKNRDEVLEKFARDAQITQKLSSVLDSFLLSISDNKPFNFHCIGVNFPNIEMVACNTTKLPKNYQPQDIQYMGMHNDGTQKMTIHNAHKFGNRISINLSNESRSFLFVNLSLIQAFNMLKKRKDIDIKSVNISNIDTYFFRYFPNYPVIKVLLKPYEYYIAATDNCFHDGSTLGNKELDICIIFFGKFQPLK